MIYVSKMDSRSEEAAASPQSCCRHQSGSQQARVVGTWKQIGGGKLKGLKLGPARAVFFFFLQGSKQ